LKNIHLWHSTDKSKNMKKETIVSLVTIITFWAAAAGFPGCSQQSDINQNSPPQRKEATENKNKALVIYYSRTGNTRIVAETLQESLSADLQEIKDLKDRSGIRGFISGMIDVKKNPITAIDPKTVDLSRYRLIFICSPVWGMKLAPAITTFLDTADFADKKIVLAAVASGRMKSSTFEQCGRLIQTKGGEVVGTIFLKSMFKKHDAIAEAAKKIAAENAQKWTR